MNFKLRESKKKNVYWIKYLDKNNSKCFKTIPAYSNKQAAIILRKTEKGVKEILDITCVEDNTVDDGEQLSLFEGHKMKFLIENELVKRHKKHKKTIKPGAMGSFIHPDGGNQVAIDSFNNSVDMGAVSSSSGLGESVNGNYAENKLRKLISVQYPVSPDDDIQLSTTPKGNYLVKLNGRKLMILGKENFRERDIDELRLDGYFRDYNEENINESAEGYHTGTVIRTQNHYSYRPRNYEDSNSSLQNVKKVANKIKQEAISSRLFEKPGLDGIHVTGDTVSMRTKRAWSNVFYVEIILQKRNTDEQIDAQTIIDLIQYALDYYDVDCQWSLELSGDGDQEKSSSFHITLFSSTGPDKVHTGAVSTSLGEALRPPRSVKDVLRAIKLPKNIVAAFREFGPFYQYRPEYVSGDYSNHRFGKEFWFNFLDFVDEYDDSDELEKQLGAQELQDELQAHFSSHFPEASIEVEVDVEHGCLLIITVWVTEDSSYSDYSTAKEESIIFDIFDLLHNKYNVIPDDDSMNTNSYKTYSLRFRGPQQVDSIRQNEKQIRRDLRELLGGGRVEFRTGNYGNTLFMYIPWDGQPTSRAHFLPAWKRSRGL